MLSASQYRPSDRSRSGIVRRKVDTLKAFDLARSSNERSGLGMMRARPSRPFSALGALLAVTFFAACDLVGPSGPRTVTVWPDTVELAFSGDTVQLLARDERNFPLAGEAVTWASSATAVATVDASGLVTAGVADGTATITASAGEASGVAMVWVSPMVLDGNEQFPGQFKLMESVGGDLGGTLFIVEEEGDWHGELVKKTAINAGAPESHITMGLNWTNRDDETLIVPEDTRALASPWWPAIDEEEGRTLAKQNAVLAVPSAGNADEDTNWQRDVYHPNHPEGSDLAGVYQDVMPALRVADGKAVLATWAIINEDGTASPWERAVSCGDTKDWCFAVRMPDDLYRLRDETTGYPGTSLAAPILGALVFYLSQLWDTADEVFAVLKECAIDIGEPGPDREFGLGVPTAHCDVVRERARQVSSASTSARGPSPAVPSFAAPAGTGLSPPGVSSSPAGSERWSYFAGGGVRKTVLAGNTASLWLLSRAERGGGRSRP